MPDQKLTAQVTDMRTQKEIATYRGHNRDVTCAAWHPLHEELFASGGYDGSLMYWLVSDPEPQVLLYFCEPDKRSGAMTL